MKIKALGYLGFDSPNADSWETFGPEVFGLGLGERGKDGAVRLRMDDRYHRIAIHPGTTNRLAYIGRELRDNMAFATAVEECAPQAWDRNSAVPRNGMNEAGVRAGPRPGRVCA